MQGECRFGDRCNFAHGEQELRQLPSRPGEDGTGGRFGRGGGRGGYGGYGRGRGRGGYYEGGGGRGGYGGYGRGRGRGGYYEGGGGYDDGRGQQGGPGGGGGGGGDVWSSQGYPTPGPNGWVMYKTQDTGEPYFHNHATGSTQWERPTDWPAGGPGGH